MSTLSDLISQPFYRNIDPYFTYVGIGTCPHVYSLEEYTAKTNQLIPTFVRDVFETHEDHPDWTLRMLHIDPCFTQKLPFLQAYFTQEGLTFSFQSEDIYVWSAPGIQVILLAQKILDHQDPYSGKPPNVEELNAIIETSALNNRKLVLQSFVGDNTQAWFQRLYEKSHDPASFRRNILFDVTYGNDTGCSSDMSVYKPFYDRRGDFINILLYSRRELLDHLQEHPEIAARARRLYYAAFREILNKKHVDYRRLVQKMTDYEISFSTPEEAMADIRAELLSLCPSLMKLGLLSSKGKDEMISLLDTYRSHDMYKWYNAVLGLVKLEDPPAHSFSQPQ